MPVMFYLNSHRDRVTLFNLKKKSSLNVSLLTKVKSINYFKKITVAKIASADEKL